MTLIEQVRGLVGGEWACRMQVVQVPTSERNLHGNLVTQPRLDPNTIVVRAAHTEPLDEHQLCMELIRLTDVLLEAGLMPRIHLTRENTTDPWGKLIEYSPRLVVTR